jgi:hypothetical protein
VPPSSRIFCNLAEVIVPGVAADGAGGGLTGRLVPGSSVWSAGVGCTGFVVSKSSEGSADGGWNAGCCCSCWELRKSSKETPGGRRTVFLCSLTAEDFHSEYPNL